MERQILPIKTENQIDLLRAKLSLNPKHLFIFDLMTQTGLSLNLALELKKRDLDDLKVGDSIPLRNASEEIKKYARMTPQLFSSYQKYVRDENLEPGNHLLMSRKGHNPLTPQSVSRLVSNWFLEAGFSDLKGVKSLRKTWEVYYKGHFGNEAPSNRANSTTDTIGALNAYTLTDQVENRLIELILTGQIPPGRRLIIKEIANEMGISPMPVRDALTRLVAGGIVHLEKNRGYEANTVTESEFKEIAELRSVIEPIAAVSGCRHTTKEDIEKLRGFAGDFKKALQNEAPQEGLRFNHDFHFGLYHLSRRPILIQFLNKLWDMTSPYYHLLSKELKSYSSNQIKHGEYYQNAFLHHEKIIEALENKNEKELSKWIKADIDSSAKKVLSDFYNNW